MGPESEKSMRTYNAIIAHGSGIKAGVLAKGLQGHFQRVDIASNYETLRERLARQRAQFVVVDMELVTEEELHELCSEFADTGVVCVHRIPDDTMWTRALEAGAIDCCRTDDLRSILNAARTVTPRRPTLAA
jgi:DNA-binding NtrC family response regulator